jgi:hypothetical protein
MPITVVSATLAVAAGVVGSILLSFIRRISTSPNRPAFTCFMDSLCEPFMFLKVGSWSTAPDVHAAMKIAMKETGLTDWGTKNDFGFSQRYNTVRTIGLKKSKAKYSPVGHYYVLQSLTRRMATRLQFFDYLKKHPQILDIKLRSPVFVIGFPRTGTTFLHEMLGLHEGVRMHYTWEQMDPVPKTHEESIEAQKKDGELRYKKNLPAFNWLFKHIFSQRIQDIHRVAYDEPEECTTPCAMELPWNISEIAFNPFAIDEVAPLGSGDAFKQYRKFLQLLTWSGFDRRDQDFTWMLKCPFHLPYLDALHKEFPDATIVWTHRDPADCIASACSLYETLMCMGMEESSIDKVALGKAVMNYTKVCLTMALRTIAALGDKFKILHIRYGETIKTPKETCKKVYAKVPLISRGDLCSWT